MNAQEYFARLYSDVFAKSNATPDGTSEPPTQYFEGHKPRFEATVAMWNEFLDDDKIGLVYDMGTGVPFVSYYFHATQGAEVVFGMPGASSYGVSDKVRAMHINLSIDPPALPAGDLVICTECLEHLATNLYKVRAYLMGLVKPGKYMMLSFPLGGANAQGYWRDGLGDPTLPCTPHIREFTTETAREFYYGTGWDVLKEVTTFTQAYGKDIMNVLLRRPA
jgi:hypothetical protein